MKMRTISLALLFTAGIAAIGTGCDKIKEKIFQAFSTRAINTTFTIPIINSTDTATSMGVVMNEFNVDSIIKAETNGQFSLADIKKISVKSAKLHLLDPDQDNNFANFEEGWLHFHTNTNPADVTVATGTNPDIYAEDFILPAVDVNLKDYLNGNQLFYEVIGKARRVTTKTLTCELTVEFDIQ